MQKYKLQNSPLLIDSKTYIPYELIKLIDQEMRATSGIEFTVGDNADYQEMLKKALTWADGLKTRDGKPRYEMMTEDMQKEFIELQKAYVGSQSRGLVGAEATGLRHSHSNARSRPLLRLLLLLTVMLDSFPPHHNRNSTHTYSLFHF